MLFEKSVLLEYIIKGIQSEIDERMETIEKGNKILEERSRGIFVLGKSKTTNEVREIIERNKVELKKLNILKINTECDLKLEQSEMVKYVVKGIDKEMEIYQNEVFKERNTIDDCRQKGTLNDLLKNIRNKEEKINKIYRLREDLIYAIEIDEFELADSLEKSTANN